MTDFATVLRAFVASPGDVLDERAVLDEVVTELNVAWGNTIGVRIELVKWETHTYPSAGERVQQTITEQIGSDYDIFIGLMWTRFGTPTGEHGSGTEEEFRAALERYRADPNSVHIMFYFKNAPIAPNQLDPEQLARVHAFKKSLGSEGVYHWSFATTKEFANFVRLHLARVVQALSAKPTKVERPKLIKSNSDSDELGILDHVEAAEERLLRAGASLKRITEAMMDSAAALTRRSKEMNEANVVGGIGIREMKRMAGAVADDLDVFVQRVKIEIPVLRDNYAEGLRDVALSLALTSEDLKIPIPQSKALQVTLQTNQNALQLYMRTVAEARLTVERLPRVTTILNRAKRRTFDVLNELEETTRAALQSIADALKLL